MGRLPWCLDSGFLANRSVSRWMKQGTRKMRCGRTSVRSGEFDSKSKGLARTTELLSVAMALRKEVITGWSRILAEFNCVWKPLYLVAGIRHISRFLDPVLWTILAGAERVRICSVPRTLPFRGQKEIALYPVCATMEIAYDGVRKWPKVNCAV